MRRLLIMLTAVLLVLLGISATAPFRLERYLVSYRVDAQSAPTPLATSPTKGDLEAEKYAVYSALIRDLYVRDETKLLVIGEITICDKQPVDEKTKKERRDFEEVRLSTASELNREALEDYYAHEGDCHSLSKRLDIPVSYVLFTAEDAKQLFTRSLTAPDDGWQRFYEKYPGASGSIYLSNVGFSSEMDQAIVSTGIGCGSLCGQGYFVLLTKERGVWKVKSKISTWVS